jgi:hypothetical protein
LEALGNGSGSRKLAGFDIIGIGSSAPITRLLLLSDIFVLTTMPSRRKGRFADKEYGRMGLLISYFLIIIFE